MSKEEKVKSKTAVSNKKNPLKGMNTKKLADLRIIQKYLVYVIGLSSGLANKEVLGKYEYFGQYGAIQKIVVNKTKAYNPNGPSGPSYSAYISYSSPQEASIAILAIDNIEVDDHVLRASYGTTKYCTYFLKNLECPNKDCLYLHFLAEDSDIINRDEMNSHTNIFYEQQLLAMKLADIFNADVKKKLKIATKKKCVFPSTDTIYTKHIVLEQNNEYHDYQYYDREQYKYKKKYHDEYNEGYYNRGYSDDYGNDYQEEEEDGYLNIHREKSENFTSKKFVSGNKSKSKFNSEIDTNNENSKFISKSKSPITNKKKHIPDQEIAKSLTYNNSLSPTNKKLEMDPEAFSSDANPDSNNTKNNNISIVSGNKNISSNSTSSSPKKLYRKREESRFSFVKKDDKENIVKFSNENPQNKEIVPEVPDYVSDVICKKISRHTFFRNFDKFFEKENNDYIFVEKCLKPDDSWSKFIISNMSDTQGEKQKSK